MEWIRIFASTGEMEAALSERTPRLLLAGSKRICLVRVAQRLYAVQDTCSHNGESLSKGKVNFAEEIVCPWHGQRFQLSTGREAGENSPDLVTYPIRIEADGVYLGI